MKVKDKTSIFLASTLLILSWICFDGIMTTRYGPLPKWEFQRLLTAICATSGLVVRILLELVSQKRTLCCLVSTAGLIAPPWLMFGAVPAAAGSIAYAAGLLVAAGVIRFSGYALAEDSQDSVSGRSSDG